MHTDANANANNKFDHSTTSLPLATDTWINVINRGLGILSMHELRICHNPGPTSKQA
ncbi:Uu.00g053730.m01.CDS01 [Anthostomella pinea]|uniref:Uu.00g053730.m01.CDS01 n=1 Tax=Anthostomella pinea TaxID=933095 RepID=A0AAI8VXQ1_9PEZI|nr:Uu.00g053730.m01.CDS01 [Anthostomella pinea]